MLSSSQMIDRLKLFLDTSSDSDLARIVGVVPATVSGWRSRGTIPIQHFLEIAERENLNLNWLLLGEGKADRQQDAKEWTGRGQDLDNGDQPEGVEQDTTGLAKLASLARLGNAGGEWKLLEKLLDSDPKGLTIDELVAALGIPVAVVTSYVTMLKHLGVVTEDSSSGVRLLRLCDPPEIGALESQGVPDHHQHALAAASHLVEVVLPAIEDQRGRLVLKKGRLGRGQARRLVESLCATVDHLVAEAAEAPGEEEGISVILAVAAEPGVE